MEVLPASLAERLRELTYNERAVAYLHVDAALTLMGADGHSTIMGWRPCASVSR